MGDSDLPTSQRIEKQDAIISQLRNKLDIDLENFEKLRCVNQLFDVLCTVHTCAHVSSHLAVFIHTGCTEFLSFRKQVNTCFIAFDCLRSELKA